MIEEQCETIIDYVPYDDKILTPKDICNRAIEFANECHRNDLKVVRYARIISICPKKGNINFKLIPKVPKLDCDRINLLLPVDEVSVVVELIKDNQTVLKIITNDFSKFEV